MKYEYTITDKKHGQNQMRAGLILSLSTISLYLLLSFFHPTFHFDSLVIIAVFMLFALVGIVIYRDGEKRRDRDLGLWSFLVNQNGVYLSAPDSLTRHVTLDKIIAIEKVDLDENEYMYILAHQDKINFNLGLSTNLNLDFDKVIDVLGYYKVKVINVSAFSKLQYKRELEKKSIKYQNFDDGFEF